MKKSAFTEIGGRSLETPAVAYLRPSCKSNLGEGKKIKTRPAAAPEIAGFKSFLPPGVTDKQSLSGRTFHGQTRFVGAAGKG